MPRPSSKSTQQAREKEQWEINALNKPKLRGVIHVISFFISIFAGLYIVYLSPPEARPTVFLYSISGPALFGVSGLLHYPTWAPHQRDLLGRVDHSMIFFLIAGSYSPFCTLVPRSPDALLSGNEMLLIIWVCALVGVGVRMYFYEASKMYATIPYLMLGWAILIDPFQLVFVIRHIGLLGLLMMLTSGLLYTGGAFSYGMRWPNPVPRVFGYHEVFHACVFVAWLLHFLTLTEIVLPQLY
eukprot:TRINITY_DN3292_c1_g1_i1.p1 TRINITY_DN3292_c1_g1~~TRINITY_DN3292_c1_g1_i1.p1  ORF type:complete len:276 (+),score=10.48 TRINITY_DN3292_c1_g1_i1:107-829(+)